MTVGEILQAHSEDHPTETRREFQFERIFSPPDFFENGALVVKDNCAVAFWFDQNQNTLKMDTSINNLVLEQSESAFTLDEADLVALYFRGDKKIWEWHHISGRCSNLNTAEDDSILLVEGNLGLPIGNMVLLPDIVLRYHASSIQAFQTMGAEAIMMHPFQLFVPSHALLASPMELSDSLAHPSNNGRAAELTESPTLSNDSGVSDVQEIDPQLPQLGSDEPELPVIHMTLSSGGVEDHGDALLDEDPDLGNENLTSMRTVSAQQFPTMTIEEKLALLREWQEKDTLKQQKRPRPRQPVNTTPLRSVLSGGDSVYDQRAAALRRGKTDNRTGKKKTKQK